MAHGAFVLRSAIASFPKGSIHLVAVDTVGHRGNSYLSVLLDGHYFLLPDHGMLGLLSDGDPELVVELPVPQEKPSAFPALDVLVPAAIALANGKSMKELGTPTTEYHKMVGRQMRIHKDQIIGHVVRVDHYGNLITNIQREEFCNLSQGKQYTILIGREQFRQLNQSINETGSGDCFVIFNSMDLLEIGINKGNASELMGLQFDSPIKITFQ